MCADRSKQPQTAGQYYLIEELAQGGMAKIYKGLSYDEHGLKKTVVIKKILPHIAADEEFINSLVAEAKIAVTLSHGNIAHTYDLGKSGDDYFIVMEFVDGKSLSAIHKRCLKMGKLIPIPALCHFMCEVLSGIDYMHRLKIIHRDISPQNLMLTYAGTIKIIDFGIARTIKAGTTDSGVLKGKFAYMSPEQARGETIDQRSDLFSLGVIFHEFLTGQRLFKSDDNRQTIRNVRQAKVEVPSNIKENIPEGLDRIVMKALAKDRRHRYAFAADMRDDLLKFLATNYSHYKASEITKFMQEIFKVDIEKAEEQEDLKTPVQIIESTQSALADDSQFEDTGISNLPPEMQEQANEDKDKTMPDKLFSPKSWFRKHAKVLLGTLGVAVLVSSSVFFFSYEEKTTPPKILAKAEVLLTTEPANANVYLDDNFIGAGSPITIKEISTRQDHIIKVEKPGYITQTKTINLIPGEFENFSIVLAPTEKPKYVLSLTSEPSNALIYINDKDTNLHTPATISSLKLNKTYNIGLYLKGYKFWNKTIEAKPNVHQNFDIQLQINYASLQINTSPPKALILLNNNPVGQAPVNINKLEPHKIYQVEAWLDGYQPYTTEIRLDAGKKKEMHLKLDKH